MLITALGVAKLSCSSLLFQFVVKIYNVRH